MVKRPGELWWGNDAEDEAGLLLEIFKLKT